MARLRATRPAIGRVAWRHRGGQFVAALGAHLMAPDDGPARAALPEELAELFALMSPADRRHCLDVHDRLVAAGHRDHLLLRTALLHDVGKAGGGVTVVHRAARVLLATHAERLWLWLSGSRRGWRGRFWVLAHHPDLGADWALERGAEGELAELIRYHEAAMPAEWAGTAQGARHTALTAVDAIC